MKKIILTLAVLLTTISCKAQLNELTSTEFYDIKVNNISLRQIENANADLTLMNNLFNENFSYKSFNLPQLGREFWNSNFLIRLEDETNQNSSYSLSYIEAKTSLALFSVRGTVYKIGDDISVFGNLKINIQNGDNSIVFVDKNTGSVALSFEIDRSTNKVTKIEFNAY